jgi:hypothetical protein
VNKNNGAELGAPLGGWPLKAAKSWSPGLPQFDTTFSFLRLSIDVNHRRITGKKR